MTLRSNKNYKLSVKKQIENKFNQFIEQRWLDKGLLGKMSGMVVVGVLSLMVIFAILGISSARQTTQQALSDRIKFAQLTADLLDTSLSNLTYSLSRIAQFNLLDEPETNQEEILSFLDNVMLFDHGVHVLDLNGNDLLKTEEIPHPIVQWKDVPAVINALQGKDDQNVSVLIKDNPWMVLAVPMYGAGNELTGALVATLDLSDARIFPSQVSFGLGETGILEIVDNNGYIIHSSQPQRIMQKETGEVVLQRLFESVETGVETCLGCTYNSQLQTVDQVVAFAPLHLAPWGVVIRQDVNEAFKPVNMIILQISIMAAVSIIGALGMVWLTTRSVITPIQSLSEAATRISAGDLDTPVKTYMEDWPFRHRRRQDEIGELIDRFDQMRSQLKQSIDEIHNWNLELDQRVQERTQQAITAQMEAQSTRDDLRAIMDALDDELVVINVDDYTIQQLNKAVLDHHKIFIPDPIGRSCYELMHEGNPCNLPNCECPLPNVVESRESVRLTQVRIDPKSNQEQYLDIVASPLMDANGNITRIVELTRDITEEKRIKEALLQKNQQLAILNRIAETVNESLNLKEMLERSLAEVLRLTGIDVGAIFLLDDSYGDLNLMAHQGLTKEAAQLASQLGMLDGSCGGVIERGQVAIVPDLNRYRGKKARSLQEQQLSSLMHVPLTAKGCTLGSMCVATKESHAFGKEDEDLLTAIGRQIAVAIENTRLYAEVQQKEHIRAMLYKKILNAQEEERLRIARELHDDISQALTALIFAAEEGLESTSKSHNKQRLANMRNVIQETLDVVHQIIFDLRPSMLDHLGLIPAIRWFAESHLEPKGIRVTITQQASISRMSPDIEITLFRVIQESIVNIARHSAARNVDLSINQNEKEIQVNISDDGLGFDLDEVTISPDSGRGLGLLGMQERLELLDGNLFIETSPGQGTKIQIKMPINGKESTNGRSTRLDR